MNEYDSILKEKKIYQDPEPIKHSKFTKYVLIYFIILLVILVGSYYVFYHTILTGENILFHDIDTIVTNYGSVFSPLQLSQLKENGMFQGQLFLKDKSYAYKFMKDNNRLKMNLTDSNHEIIYYVEDNERYLQIPSLGNQYLLLNERSYYGWLSRVQTNFKKYIQAKDYIKKFYLKDRQPIVEINLVFTQEMITKILDDSLSQNYEIIVTLKNHAITNQLISMKVVFNNQTNHTREVLTYQDGIFSLVDTRGMTTRFVLEKKELDFNLKIYKEDTLYSVLTGSVKEKSYQYMYQVIDEIYNIHLEVSEDEEGLYYHFISNQEEDGVTKTETVDLQIQHQQDVLLDHAMKESIPYQKLTEEEQKKYDLQVEQIFQPLRQFINHYH